MVTLTTNAVFTANEGSTCSKNSNSVTNHSKYVDLPSSNWPAMSHMKDSMLELQFIRDLNAAYALIVELNDKLYNIEIDLDNTEKLYGNAYWENKQLKKRNSELEELVIKIAGQHFA